jgi:predicted sulfurtransferase
MADASASSQSSPVNDDETVVLLFYKYVALTETEVAALEEWMLAQGAKFALTGRVLLAVEGVNANVAGSSKAIRAFCDGIRTHAILNKEADGSGKIDLKLDSVKSMSPNELFPDFKVQQKKEICSTGNKMKFELLGQGMGGKHLDPKEFHAVLQEYWTEGGEGGGVGGGGESQDKKKKKKELVVIDVRNRKEFEVGRFEHTDNSTGEINSAVDPNTKLFNDWATHFAEREAPALRDKKVLMYCTGE